MGLLDMRTILFSLLISNFVSTIVMILLLLQNGNRFKGTIFWIINFSLQTISLLLIIVRGLIPDWISIVAANALVITGVLLGLIGLEKFLNKKSRNIHNYILITAFIVFQYWTSLINPNLELRNLNFSITMLILCFQCSWLLIYRVPAELKKITIGVGLVFAVYCLVNVVRIIEYLIPGYQSNNYLEPGHFEKIVIYSYQALFLMLTFSLILMFNRRLQKVLEIEEEKFSKAFHSSPYACLITRFDDGVIIEVNERFCSVTGYSLEDVIGKANKDLHIWKSEKDRESVIGEILTQEKIVEKECRFLRKSGQEFIALLSAEIININNKPCFLGSLNDISLRKKAEDDLKESNRKLQTLINNLNGVAYRCMNDKEWTMQFISDGVLDLTGYEPQEFIQNRKRSFNSVIYPDDQPGIWNKIQIAVEEKKPYILEYRINTVSGEQRWVWERGRAIFDQKELIALEGFISDITERKIAEDEVHRLNSELEARVVQRTLALEEKTAELEAFSYSVSHDLRAPLRALNGFSRILLNNYSAKIDEEGQKLLNFIISNAKKMSNLINDLLAFSRLGKQEIKTATINMQSMVNSVINELTSLDEKKQCDFKVTSISTCTGDPSMIRQIWINLISNAIKFSSKTAKSQIEIGNITSDTENVYYVKDNGVGFNSKYADKLFGVFQRLHSENDFEGTGVGLAIVKRTIQRMGGKVWAESKINEGATFYFSIPI